MTMRLATSIAFLGLALVSSRSVRAQAEALPPLLSEAQPAAASPARVAETGQQKPTAPTSAAPLLTDSVPRRGLVLMPSVGFAVPVGSTAEGGYSSSYRLGALIGWHLTSLFSLNGECNLEFVDANTDASFWRPHELFADFTLSPLFHIQSGEVLIGPKLGWFRDARSEGERSGRGQGYLLGLNAGLFLPLRGLMVGGLVSGAFRHFTSFTCDGFDASDTSCTAGTGRENLYLTGNRSGRGGVRRTGNVETVTVSGAVLF